MAKNGKVVDISDELISKFRDTVNGNNMFVFQEYVSKNGKNQWNPICSCMDWISVAIRAIAQAPELSSHIDVRVMQIYSLISSIDIVNEAIISLHSILFGVNARVSPFQGKAECFRYIGENIDDDTHFKEIRASFGAHPVNLNGKNGERLFASWPHDGLDQNYDIQVRLYSNLVGHEDRTFGIKLEELGNFLSSRYYYLDVLINEINRQYEEYLEKLRNQPIALSDDIMKQLEILESESKKRLNNEYYSSTILELKMIFGSTTGLEQLKEKEAEFKNSQLKLINEVFDNLQSMKLVDLVHCDLLKTRPPELELSYELPKLYSWIYSQQNDLNLDFYMRRLNEVSEGHYQFSKDDGPERTFLKLKIFLHSFDN